MKCLFLLSVFFFLSREGADGCPCIDINGNNIMVKSIRNFINEQLDAIIDTQGKPVRPYVLTPQIQPWLYIEGFETFVIERLEGGSDGLSVENLDLKMEALEIKAAMVGPKSQQKANITVQLSAIFAHFSFPLKMKQGKVRFRGAMDMDFGIGESQVRIDGVDEISKDLIEYYGGFVKHLIEGRIFEFIKQKETPEFRASVEHVLQSVLGHNPK